jgi:hypothetical protein
MLCFSCPTSSRSRSRRMRYHINVAYQIVNVIRLKKKANIIFGPNPPPELPNIKGCWVRHKRMAMKLMGTEIKATMPYTAACDSPRIRETG